MVCLGKLGSGDLGIGAKATFMAFVIKMVDCLVKSRC